MRFPKEIELMMLEMEVARRERLVAQIKADPISHKTTLQWTDGVEPRWLYYDGGVDRRGVRRRFCYTTTRNAAGYFLAFNEIVRKDGNGERRDIVASKRRKTVAAKAKARWEVHLATHKPKPKPPIEERRTTYWISEQTKSADGRCVGSRGLGEVRTKGGPNNALDKARIMWPDAGDLVATHIGRR